MADKLEFRGKLAGIYEVAEAQGHKMTCEEVEQYFAEDKLTKEQLELVFDYLLSKRVAVKGYVKSGGTVTEASDEKIQSSAIYTPEEEAYLEEYLTDLQAIKGQQEGELELLFAEVNKGNQLAKGRITEIYLPKIVEIGKDMNQADIFIGDLIQEGNVSLMIALEMLPNIEETGYVGIEEYLEAEIRQGIQMMIEETGELKNRDHKMVQQVSDLDESITKLTDDLGRKVTIEELALYMEMPEESILEILKLTGEEVEEEGEGVKVEDLGIEVL